jgi:DNA-binding transcriptional regulator YiaG
MYKYTESGLRGIRLANGYRVERTPYGNAVSIQDVDGLHQAIGRRLARKPKRLSSTEFRFLRKELGWSQQMLAEFLGTSEQTLSLWERGSRIPLAAERLLRLVYLEHVNGNVAVQDSVKQLTHLDRRIAEGELVFEHQPRKHAWREAA